MKKWATQLFMKYMLGDWQEKALSYLPANGKKTYISIAVTLLSIAVGYFGGGEIPILDILQGGLQGAGGENLLSASDVTAIIGLIGTGIGIYHKILKGLKKLEGK